MNWYVKPPISFSWFMSETNEYRASPKSERFGMTWFRMPPWMLNPNLDSSSVETPGTFESWLRM